MRTKRKNKTTALPKSKRQKRIATANKKISQPAPMMKLLPKNYAEIVAKELLGQI